MAEVNGTASPQPRSQPTPPGTSSAANNTQPSHDPSSQTTTAAAGAGAQPISTTTTTTGQPTHIPTTSLADPGTSTRPRDARTIHLLLSSLGVSAYQDRVPLQLLDFAYRYTSSVLSDAAHLAAEGYVSGGGSTTGKGAGANAAAGSSEIGLAALRLATSSRLGYQFSTQGAGGGAGALPKEALLELAQERNKTRLPPIQQEPAHFGVRLPAERYCLTGGAWRVMSEWDSMEEVEDGENGEKADGDGDAVMGEGQGEGEDDGFEKYTAGREEEDEDQAMDDE